MKKLWYVVACAWTTAVRASLETMLEFNALVATAEHCRHIKKDMQEKQGEQLPPEVVQMCDIVAKKLSEFVISRYANNGKKPRSRIRS